MSQIRLEQLQEAGVVAGVEQGAQPAFTQTKEWRLRK
jgi:hypothetical protein